MTIQSDFFGPMSKSGIMTQINQVQINDASPPTGICVGYGTFKPTKSGAFSGSGEQYCADVTLGNKTGAWFATYTESGSTKTDSARDTTSFVTGFGGLAGIKGGCTITGTISANAGTYDCNYTLP